MFENPDEAMFFKREIGHIQFPGPVKFTLKEELVHGDVSMCLRMHL